MTQSNDRRASVSILAGPILLGSLLATFGGGAPARAQTRDEIRQQQEQLYQQYQDGPGQPEAPPAATGDDGAYAGGGGMPAASGGGLTAQLLDRVTTLESEVRTLRGRVDELQQELGTSTAALNKQIGDLSFQVQQGSGGRAAAAAPDAGIPAAPVASPASPRAEAPRPDGAAPGPRLTPETALRQGNLALARHDYDGAEAAANLALHGPHAAEAQYLLAGAYAGQRNYQQAAVAYYGSYTKNPRGPMAPAALYHVGTSMAALGQTGAACEALGKLRGEFPSMHGGVASSAAGLSHRLHC